MLCAAKENSEISFLKIEMFGVIKMILILGVGVIFGLYRYFT